MPPRRRSDDLRAAELCGRSTLRVFQGVTDPAIQLLNVAMRPYRLRLKIFHRRELASEHAVSQRRAQTYGRCIRATKLV